MTKVTRFDKPTCQVLSDEAIKALVDWAEYFGVKISPAGGKIGIGQTTFTMHLQFDLAGELGAVAEREAFSLVCGRYGLRPDDYGARFFAKGEFFTIFGFDLGRPKYCVRARDSAGRERIWSEGILKSIRPASAA